VNLASSSDPEIRAAKNWGSSSQSKPRGSDDGAGREEITQLIAATKARLSHGQFEWRGTARESRKISLEPFVENIWIVAEPTARAVGIPFRGVDTAAITGTGLTEQIAAELRPNTQQFRATETTLARACGLTDRVKNHKQEKIHLISHERPGQFPAVTRRLVTRQQLKSNYDP